MSRKIIVHKVNPNENIDGILTSTYVLPSKEHLYALRTMVANMNGGNTSYSASHCGTTIHSQPWQNDFLILPTDSDLDHTGFYSDKPNFSQFDSYGHNLNINTHGLHGKFSKIQNHIEPTQLAAYCEMVDGMCANLAQEKEHKFSHYLAGYAGESLKEVAKKFSERASEVTKLIKEIDKLAVEYKSYKGPGGMHQRQSIKAKIILKHNELQHVFSEKLQIYMRENANRVHVRKFFNVKHIDAFSKVKTVLKSGDGGAKNVFYKAKWDRAVEYVKYAEHFGDALTAVAFIQAQMDALSAKKEGKDWQKELFVEDSAVLGMIFGGAVATAFLPAELPILLGASLSAGITYTFEEVFKTGAEKGYKKWLE